jgi:charged multivesicular body protein 4
VNGQGAYLVISTPDKVDATMASINEQREIANEISDAISNPLNAGIDLDEVTISLFHYSKSELTIYVG